MSSPPARILVVHPRLGYGGSEVVVAWIAQSLAKHHYVTLATTGAATLNQLDCFAGTQLERIGVELLTLETPGLLKTVNLPAALRGSLFTRQVRAIAANYDVLISGYEFLPFGSAGIHYIHGDSSEIRASGSVDGHRPLSRLIHRPGVVRNAYLTLCALTAGMRQTAPSDIDVLIANSCFTAENVLRAWNLTAEVVHPPVPPIQRGLDWARRENTVIMLGRIERSKRTMDGIEIVRALRAAGHDLKLRIVGPLADKEYSRQVVNACHRYGSWLTVAGALRSPEKSELLGRSRYLLHCKRAEPFGIALVEAAKSGCICLAPKGGGYEDFISDEGLLFEDIENAVVKFDKLLREDDAVLAERQDRLKEDADLVGQEFEPRLIDIVNVFITTNRLAKKSDVR
jgi:glycosyltransferase involved in cell wall biosynthesis